MKRYDLLIVGGGIHGVGVAQAAAVAGYRTLLLEKNQLASGTSRCSSKLIHGGLRYLESGQFGLVRECLMEQQLLLKLAPQLVSLDAFHIPVYPQTSRRPLLLRMGLSIYAALGNFQSSCRFNTLKKVQWDQLNGINQAGLQTVFRYYDGLTDDVGLTQAVMGSAISYGAELEQSAEFQEAELGDDGVQIVYHHKGVRNTCVAKALVNAGGPWVNELLKKIAPAQRVEDIEWVQGTHIVLEGQFNSGVFYLEAPQDGRAVFIRPWKSKLLVGTTEILFQQLPENIIPSKQEQDYLLEVVLFYFPQLKNCKIVDSFAGLRVLPASRAKPFCRSRETVLHRSHPRLMSIYGGKLTSYRLTAERVISQIKAILPERKSVTTTDKVMLTI